LTPEKRSIYQGLPDPFMPGDVKEAMACGDQAAQNFVKKLVDLGLARQDGLRQPYYKVPDDAGGVVT
jgi:hypothetical protein